MRVCLAIYNVFAILLSNSSLVSTLRPPPFWTAFKNLMVSLPHFNIPTRQRIHSNIIAKNGNTFNWR